MVEYLPTRYKKCSFLGVISSKSLDEPFISNGLKDDVFASFSTVYIIT